MGRQVDGMREGGWIRGGGIDRGRKLDEPHHSPYCLILQVMVEPCKAGAEKGRRLRPLPTAAPNSEPQEPSIGEGGRKVDELGAK